MGWVGVRSVYGANHSVVKRRKRHKTESESSNPELQCLKGTNSLHSMGAYAYRYALQLRLVQNYLLLPLTHGGAPQPHKAGHPARMRVSYVAVQVLSGARVWSAGVPAPPAHSGRARSSQRCTGLQGSGRSLRTMVCSDSCERRQGCMEV